MRPDSVSQVGERAILHMVPDVEGGGFFDVYSRPASVGRMALIHGIPTAHVHEIYEGNTELLYKDYVVPREGQLGVYELRNGTTVTIINSRRHNWEPGTMTLLHEFAPVQAKQ